MSNKVDMRAPALTGQGYLVNRVHSARTVILQLIRPQFAEDHELGLRVELLLKHGAALL